MPSLKQTVKCIKQAWRSPRGRRLTRRAGLLAILTVVLGILSGLLIAYRAIKPRSGTQYLRDVGQIVFHPQDGFVGKTRINILCMGIDDNAIVNNQNGSIRYGNTDTILVLSLDLHLRKASVLSIPRDTYAHIADTTYSTKINRAYAHGGEACAMATVVEFLGLQPDHYIIVSISELQRLVDELGGIDVTVEHAMRYDDESGHLHIHLEPGYQHLDGKQALAFIRFRHAVQGGKVIVTPEHGDKRRIYRQQVAIRGMINRTYSFRSLFHCNALFDTGVSCLQTDLTRTQLLDLANLFRGLQPSQLPMSQLPATNFRAPDGGADLYVAPAIRAEYVRKLLNGQ